ncbi:murein hydrolase activator EnvC family protein [Aliiroseovarius sp. PTFE2010]|uniref:murein hydrolase activator EnvC family protein n=1 Tax=Aliiroseovarius sp. PTFE2010 TaxID=3417190 RepID=UPI003CF9750B
MSIRAIALAFALILSTGHAHAQETPSELAERAARLMEAAHRSLNDANTKANRIAALTQTVSAYEDGLDALREGLRRASIREAAIARKFDAESEKLSQLVGVLLSIQSTPATLTLIHPSGPLGTARSGIILSDVAPAFQAEVDHLRAELQELRTIRVLQESASETLILGLAGARRARTALSQAIQNRTDLPNRYLTDPEQLANLIAASETLAAFSTGLLEMDTAAGTPAVGNIRQAAGTLPLPVNGTILRRAGEADAAGIRRPGWLIATRPRALVTAPWPATIRYRGPLLDYGNVIVLEPASGILMVLAGLEEVYGEIGELLEAGAPVGLMGGDTPAPNDILLKSGEGGGADASETLYIEIRQDGDATDPADWFASNED